MKITRFRNDPGVARMPAPAFRQRPRHVIGAVGVMRQQIVRQGMQRGGGVGQLGPATATYSSKGHELHARFAGTLTAESDAARKHALWNTFVAAWFPAGQASALLLRMDLGDASIWSGELGVFNTAKMMLGLNMRDDIKGGYAEVTL